MALNTSRGLRMAGSPEIAAALRQHFESDGVPPVASTHLAAEVAAHPQEVDTDAQGLMERIAQLRQQGYDDEMAQVLAVESMERMT